jgi:hypothetical protein
MNKKERVYSEDELRNIVAMSYSYNQVVSHLKISDSGANFSTIRRDILKLEIDISHFGTQKKPQVPLKQIEDLLVGGHKKSSEVKRFLLHHNILQNKCDICGMNSEWQGKPLTLQLDHINGDSHDHSLGNLRILCPNCHSQTPTFCRKKHSPPKNTSQPKVRKERPLKFQITEDELQLLWDTHKNWSKIGKIYGVSGNAVKKRAKSFNILVMV